MTEHVLAGGSPRNVGDGNNHQHPHRDAANECALLCDERRANTVTGCDAFMIHTADPASKALQGCRIFSITPPLYSAYHCQPNDLSDSGSSFYSFKFTDTYFLNSVAAYNNAPYWGRQKVPSCTGYGKAACPYLYQWYSPLNGLGSYQPCSFHWSDSECKAMP